MEMPGQPQQMRMLTDLRTTVMTGRVNGNAPSSLRVVLSLRHQDWIIRIDRATGEVLWRLGDGGDFTLGLGSRLLVLPRDLCGGRPVEGVDRRLRRRLL